MVVGREDDAHEREADHIAGQIMRMPDANIKKESFAPAVRSESAIGLNGPRMPMDSATKSFMERRFGRDFGDVRTHTGRRL